MSAAPTSPTSSLHALYQIGSGYLVLAHGQSPARSASEAIPLAGFRVMTALWDRVVGADDLGAVRMGRALGKRFDRLVVVVNTKARDRCQQWTHAEVLTASSQNNHHCVACAIGTDVAISLAGTVATMADDEVIVFYTRDVRASEKLLAKLGALRIDEIEAKPQSQRRPKLPLDSSLDERVQIEFELAS